MALSQINILPTVTRQRTVDLMHFSDFCIRSKKAYYREGRNKIKSPRPPLLNLNAASNLITALATKSLTGHSFSGQGGAQV